MPDTDYVQKTLRDFEDLYDKFLNSYKTTLVESGTKAYIQGDLKAQKALDLKLSFNLVNKDALKYIKEYKKDLEKGGGMIQGKWVPWLQNMAEEDRRRIGAIIEEAYKKGTPTGVKERLKGSGYPKNSLAYQLQEYFNMRKSHAATVARTEIARIQSHGSVNRYQKQGVSKVIWLVFNPCPICSPYARRVFEIDKVPYEVPRHPNCRCALAPVADDVPTGAAAQAKIPKVFEKNAKALPPKPQEWDPVRGKRALIDMMNEAPTENWSPFDMKIIKKEFSQEEADGLRYYVGSGYTKMNKMLRDPDPDHFKEWLADWDFKYVSIGTPEEAAAEYIKNKLKPMASAVSDAIERSTIPEEVILYRAPGRTVAKTLLDKGQVRDPGFLSTSSKFNVSYSAFGRDTGGYTDIIVLRGKPGDKALYINTGEHEVLYQKGRTLKLLGVDEVEKVNLLMPDTGNNYPVKNVRFLYCKLIEPE